MTMTRKNYVDVAYVLHKYFDDEYSDWPVGSVITVVARDMADAFAAHNLNFNRDRFMEAILGVQARRN